MKHYIKYRCVFLLVLILSFIMPTSYSEAATKISNSISAQYSNAILAYAKFLKEYNYQTKSPYMKGYQLETVQFNVIYLDKDVTPELYLRYSVINKEGEFSYLNYLFTYQNNEISLLGGDYRISEELYLYQHQNLLISKFLLEKTSYIDHQRNANLSSQCQYLTLLNTTLKSCGKDDFLKLNPKFIDNHPIDIARNLQPVTEQNIKNYCSPEIRLNYTDLILPLDGYDSYVEYLLLLGADSDNVVWESSDSSIATVDKLGLVTAMLPGTCTITATYQDKTYSCELKVPYIPDYESLAYLQIVDSNIQYHEAYLDKFENITMNHNLLNGELFPDTEIEILDSKAQESYYRKGTLDDLKRLCKEKKLVKIVMNHDLILSIIEITIP
ncbi:Ig-like domain-containing protein [Lachnoclostridium sp.]|nr:Ig-like domain-containing protein [Lachnoclostridium sp.]